MADSEQVVMAARSALPVGAQVGAELYAEAPALATRWIVLTKGTGQRCIATAASRGEPTAKQRSSSCSGATIGLHDAELAPERAFVHASVVAWRGRAIVMPGRSFTGTARDCGFFPTSDDKNSPPR